ncbi:hypothetical protein DCAR_0727547 [Daucus carota subsp. sativus]|uniref:Myb/SANT-like domain-containing protein n=1 Tax=Daucus carota subsp. sativus TaxID=79200 RepID=A0AAF0XHW6_DAUCS|nr:hypothetical protein DCAR_0727547 [Daucus carota subsp. sativus]
MGDACQENDNPKGKTAGYKTWTIEESNELLNLMVDAAKRGWRDSNGLFTKVTVGKKILPVLNEKLGCQRTHPQYVSHPITKKFTAPDEVWEEYFKSIKSIKVILPKFVIKSYDTIPAPKKKLNAPLRGDESDVATKCLIFYNLKKKFDHRVFCFSHHRIQLCLAILAWVISFITMEAQFFGSPLKSSLDSVEISVCQQCKEWVESSSHQYQQLRQAL